MTPPTSQVQDLNLRDYVRPVVSRLWLVIGIVVLVTGGTYLYYQHKPKVYTASTSIFVDSSSATAQPGDYVPETTDRTTKNQATLLTTREVADRVAKRLGRPPGAVGGVTASPDTGSDFVGITAVNSSPVEAARLANAYARAFIELRSEEQRAGLQKALEKARSQLAMLPHKAKYQADRAAAAEDIRRLQLALAIPSGQARQLDPAVPPSTPTSPKPKRSATFAFALSLIAAIGLAFGLERFDRRLKRVDDAVSAFELPLLAVLPHSGTTTAVVDGGAALSSDLREAFRQLRTNLQLEALQRPIKRILVTSAVPSEGKSVVVRNLAIAYREAGQRVAVVDSDLRRPMMASFFAHPTDKGLTTVMTGDDPLDQALLSVPVHARGLAALARIKTPAGSGADRTRIEGTSSSAQNSSGNGAGELDIAPITLLPAGPAPANPQVILSAQRMTAVLDVIAEGHDIVLIDSPPVTVVSDALSLAGQVDAVILVARLEVTTKDAARRAMEFLRRVPEADPVGVVVNDITGSESAKYTYGYEQFESKK